MPTKLLKSNAAVTSMALAISSAMNFLAIFVWTRILEPTAFGIYALVSAAALLLNAMIFEWLRLTGARTLFDGQQPFEINPERANALLSIYLGCCAVFALVSGIIWIAGVNLFGISSEMFPILTTFTLTEMGLALVNTVSRVRTEIWQYFYSMVGRSILSLIIGVGLVAGLGWGAAGAILGVVIAQAVVLFVGIACDPFWKTLRPWRPHRKEINAALLLGYPLILSCSLTYGAGVADRFLIAGVLGTAEIGHYTAPADLLQKTLVFVMMAINLTAYPTLVRTYENEGNTAAGKVMQNSFLIQLGLGLPAAVGIAVLAPGVVKLLLGAAYRSEAIRILPLLGVATLLRCLTAFQLVMAFQIKKRMTLMLIPPVLTLTATTALAPYAMHAWGVLGMAITAVSAQCLTFAATLALAKREMPLRFVSPDTLKIAAAATAMGLLVYPFRNYDGPLQTLTTVFAGASVYGACLLLFKVGPAIRVARKVPLLHRVLGKLLVP